MIAFIEGGMRIHMGKVTRDSLFLFRLCPTQCAPNLFRVLGSVDALNDNMGVNLTHYDVNWVYSCQISKDMGYYLKSRVPAIKLISCLLKTNEGIEKRTSSSFRENGMTSYTVRSRMGHQVRWLRNTYKVKLSYKGNQRHFLFLIFDNLYPICFLCSFPFLF